MMDGREQTENKRQGDLIPSNWQYPSALEDAPAYLDLYMTWVRTKPTNTSKRHLR